MPKKRIVKRYMDHSYRDELDEIPSDCSVVEYEPLPGISELSQLVHHEDPRIVESVVERLSAMDMDPLKIADFLGIGISELNERFGKILDWSLTSRTAAVEDGVYKNAVLNLDLDAQKYWLENRASDRWVSKRGSVSVEAEGMPVLNITLNGPKAKKTEDECIDVGTGSKSLPASSAKSRFSE